MTLATRIIPQLLFRGNQLAKGVAFDSWRSVGVINQAVRIHQARGVDELLLLDIGATDEGRPPNFALVEQLANRCFMPLTVGGGVRSVDDVGDLLRHGADKVAICTGAFEVEGLVERAAGRFGKQAIVGVLDVHGSLARTRCGKGIVEGSPAEWAAKLEAMGAGEILLQQIGYEGQMCGYDLNLIRLISDSAHIPVIASGGCGTYEHMHQAIQAGAHAVSAGAMFQFTDQTPRGAAEYLAAKGIEVRL